MIAHVNDFYLMTQFAFASMPLIQLAKNANPPDIIK